MQYKVIKAFNDLTDFGFLYKVGDVYPRKGIHPTEGRIAELVTDRNKLHKPLIEEIVEKAEEEKQPPKKKRGKRNEDN